MMIKKLENKAYALKSERTSNLLYFKLPLEITNKINEIIVALNKIQKEVKIK